MVIDVAGAQFSVISKGEGIPIVFLHAGVTDKRMWENQIDLVVEEGYRAIAFDRRGFGETTTEDVNFSNIDDIETIMDELEIGAAVFVGGSQGGRFSIDFALTHPERVIGLVLMGTALSGAPDAEYPDEIQPLIAAYEVADEANDVETLNLVEAHAWLDGPATSGGRVTGAIRELFLDMNSIALNHATLSGEEEPQPAIDFLGRVNQPVLLVGGSLDFPHIVERQAMLDDEMPNSFSVMIEETAHLPSLERPDLFNPILVEFLDALFGDDE